MAALSNAYRNEKDADLRERILLVRLVREDKKEASSVAEKEFHKSDGGLTNGSRDLIILVWKD